MFARLVVPAFGLLLALAQADDTAWHTHIAAGKQLVERWDYAAAEKSFLASVEATRQDPSDPYRLAFSYNELGTLYLLSGRFGEAEKYLVQAKSTLETHFGQTHPGLLRIVSHLIQAYVSQGQIGKAERLCQFALRLRGEDGDEARLSQNLASIYDARGKLREAKLAYKKAEAIWTQNFGPGHPELAAVYNNLGILCAKTGSAAEGIGYIERALAISKRAQEEDDEGIALLLANLGGLYATAGHTEKAEQAFTESLSTAEKCTPGARRAKLEAFSGYATLLRNMKRGKEAKQMEARAKALRMQFSVEAPARFSVDVRDLRK